MTIALGANTDPYQPIERDYRITRQILEVLSEFSHPVGIVTKSALVLRDIDLIEDMAKRNLVKVAVSVTTLDPKLARAMEPRAATPPKRLAEHIFHPPIEKSGSQLIGLSRVTRQRGQWHSTWVKPFGGELLDGGVQRGPPIEA